MHGVFGRIADMDAPHGQNRASSASAISGKRRREDDDDEHTRAPRPRYSNNAAQARAKDVTDGNRKRQRDDDEDDNNQQRVRFRPGRPRYSGGMRKRAGHSTADVSVGASSSVDDTEGAVNDSARRALVEIDGTVNPEWLLRVCTQYLNGKLSKENQEKNWARLRTALTHWEFETRAFYWDAVTVFCLLHPKNERMLPRWKRAIFSSQRYEVTSMYWHANRTT